jgi:hypothetical protein
MLQTVQAFGREKLEQAALLRRVEQRHGEVYAVRCRDLGRALASASEAKAANAIYDEIPNLRAAFERAITDDLQRCVELAAPLFLFNYLHRGAETGGWYARIMALPGADQLELAPILLAGAAGHAFHDGGDKPEALGFIERGFRAEAAGSRSSEGWLSGVAGQIAQWTGDSQRCIAHHATAVAQARQAGNSCCEIMSLCMAAFVKARAGDHDGADELLGQVSRLAASVTQPTLMGYIHYARGGVEHFRDPDRAIDEYQASVEWADMAGNRLGAQRVKHLIADLRAARAEPNEALAILVHMLMDLPNHGATFYNWSTVRAMLAPLSELAAFDDLAVLAGALRASPLQLNRAARSAVDEARHRLGDRAFALASDRGSVLNLAELRAYIIKAWGSTARRSG